jgi:hypothetical protein
MNSMAGSFAGKIAQRSALTLTDQPNHVLSIGEVHGLQRSSDPLWNNSTMTYWGVTDLVNGKGTQHGYFDDDHGEAGHDWGTFVGKVTTVGNRMIIEGRFEFAGGDGKYRGITGGGTFKSVMKSETDLECGWDGKYALAAKSKAA